MSEIKSTPKSLKKNKTWNEFWGEFLQVTFHKGHPDLWSARERKALWAMKHFGFKPDAEILDLGCGDGMIDVWLSRKGYMLTAVDRNENVLEHAKTTDDTKKVQFLSADLKEVEFQPQSFDGVLFLEACGLMSKENDAELFRQIHRWLKPNGKFIIDCPETVEMQNSWTREFPAGTARGVSGFDPVTRIQDIRFYFKPHGEEEFGIYDPYDLGKGDVEGIMRYIYSKNELKEVLERAGFEVQDVDHYYEKNYFGLLGKKIGS